MRTFGSTAIWLTEIYAGPCNILVQQQPMSCLIGQYVLIVKNPWRMNGPIQGLAPATSQAAIGQLKFIGNISAFA